MKSILDRPERNLERLRELRSYLKCIGLAVNPLENRFPEYGDLIFWARSAEADCERRIEEAKEAIS